MNYGKLRIVVKHITDRLQFGFSNCKQQNNTGWLSLQQMLNREAIFDFNQSWTWEWQLIALSDCLGGCAQGVWLLLSSSASSSIWVIESDLLSSFCTTRSIRKNFHVCSSLRFKNSYERRPSRAPQPPRPTYCKHQYYDLFSTSRPFRGLNRKATYVCLHIWSQRSEQ